MMFSWLSVSMITMSSETISWSVSLQSYVHRVNSTGEMKESCGAPVEMVLIELQWPFNLTSWPLFVKKEIKTEVYKGTFLLGLSR